MKILHIEDHGPTAKVVGRVLAKAGHTVVNVTTPEAACTALQHGGYDLVVSDFNLEGGTAAEVVASRGSARWVWLTSDDDCLRHLAAPFVQKPALPSAIVAAVAEVAS
jgi:CheY-like chemotaxis protein